MKKHYLILMILTAAAVYLNAQDTASADTDMENFMESSPAPVLDYGTTSPEPQEMEVPSESNTTTSEKSTTATSPVFQNHLASVPPAPSVEDDSQDKTDDDAKTPVAVLSKVLWGATVDMQVDKEMWDEFSQDSKNRLQHSSLFHAYRQKADDFWMRVALRGMYRMKNFESAFALRFYPYWTMRRKGKFQDGKDLDRYLDVLEINQAYLKLFKDYEAGDNMFGLHFKIGRDGLLSTGSQLFGNYLELPTAGYGEGRLSTVTGPFKNRKVFANMMELGFNFNLGEAFSGKTSIMIGGNVNNQKWYSAPTPNISEEMDSKLSAGFTRGYQDFYFWKERIHFGAGFRVYTTKVSTTEPVIYINEVGAPETTSTSFATDSKYINGDWTFDIAFTTNCKLYSEFGFQKLGTGSSTGVVRPFTAGLTIPTGGVLDVLAVEVENVAETFFSSESKRDPIGNRKNTESFAWGIVTEKLFLGDRIGIAWGVYTGDAYGDMKTSLRITSNLK